MALRVTWSLITFFTLFFQVFAQAVDKRWITPDGSQADFATSFVAGNTISVAWKALNNSRSDLWLTHYNVSGFPWHYQVETNIDISVGGSISWYIDVPAYTISNDNHFILRFFPLNAPYANIQAVQNASPGFLLTGGVTTTTTAGVGGVASTSQSPGTKGASSTTDTVTNTISSPSTLQTGSYSQLFFNTTSIANSSILTTTNAAGNTITATITTSVPLPTDISSQNTTSTPSQTPFPLAAQAGIGVGAGIFIILLFAAGCFFGRRIGLSRVHRKYDLQPTDTIVMESGTKFGMFGDECTKVVREATEVRPTTGHTTLSEMDDTSSMIKSERRFHNSRTPLVELMGSSTFPVEKAGTMVRPGVHEVH